MENEKDIEEMDDFEEEELEDDETLEDEDSDEDDEDLEEESDEEGDDSEKDKSKETPPNKEEEEEKKRLAQKEQNRINAERRKAEKEKREAELKKQGYNDALKEEIGGINPFTNKKIEDDVDMDMYLKMRELSKQGKDPITDYADYVAEEKRKALQQEKAKQEEETKAQKDISDFSVKYPDVDVSKLLNDEHFSSFADGKLGGKSLTEIYEDFLKFESYYENKSEEEANLKAAKKFARINSSSGSQTNAGGKIKKSYRDMSDDEFEEELRKVKEQGY